MKFFPKKNGNVIVDAITVDASVDGLVSIDVVKCPNLYGTAYNVWESNDLATIFGVATTVEPLGTLVYASVLGNNYYDTFTGTITVGTGSDITITNTGETAVDIYVVDLTTLFTTEPNEAQCDNMYKMFLFNGTGSELITLEEVFYVDYTEQVIHNLTDIYGAGNEPSLETHEALIPQYTNTVLKAKAFENTLQQELMEVKLTTPLYDGGMTYGELFDNYQLFSNGDFSDGTTGLSAFDGTLDIIENGVRLSSLGTEHIYQLIDMPNGTQYYTYIDYQRSADSGLPRVVNYSFTQNYLIPPDNLIRNQYSGVYTTFADGTGIAFYPYVGSGNYVDIWKFYLFNITALKALELYSPLYADAFNNLSDAEIIVQMDAWAKVHSVLTGNAHTGSSEMIENKYYLDYNNSKVYDINLLSGYLPPTIDEIVYEGFSYKDIFRTNNLILNSGFDNGTTNWNIINGAGLSNVDNELVVIKNNITGTFGTDSYIPTIVGEQFYINYDAKYKTIIVSTPSVYNYFRIDTSYVSNNSETFILAPEFNNFSDILTATETKGVVQLHFRTGGNVSTEIVIDNIYLVSLNIFSVPPTKVQLDTWFQTYLSRQPQALVESILAKTITLAGIPDKMWIEKDRVVILGSYVVVGE